MKAALEGDTGEVPLITHGLVIRIVAASGKNMLAILSRT
jgi:hypothetical protein